MTKTVLLSAGGTGGHLFPAHALAQELVERGVKVHLATDERAERFCGGVSGQRNSYYPFSNLSWPVANCAYANVYASAAGLSAIAQTDVPNQTARGGWVWWVSNSSHRCWLPATKGVPTILHEQNAIMGRANRFLASRVTAIASGFPIQNQDGLAGAALTVSGNPLRELAHNAANRPYVAAQLDDPFHLLVFGGSQGCAIFFRYIA